MREHPNFSRRKYSLRLWNQDSGVVSRGNCWMMSLPPTFPPPSLSPFLCLLLYCDHIQELTFLASIAKPVLHLRHSGELQSREGSSEITDSFHLEQQNRVAVSCSHRSSHVLFILMFCFVNKQIPVGLFIEGYRDDLAVKNI